jgi:hypothetical protein
MAGMRTKWVERVIEEMRAEGRATRSELERWKVELGEWDEAARARAATHGQELRALRADVKGGFEAVDAGMERDAQSTAEIIAELRAARARDREERDEMRAQREGLLRILDEMRGEGGPDGA